MNLAILLVAAAAPTLFVVVPNKADLFIDGHTEAKATRPAGEGEGYAVYVYADLYTPPAKEGDFYNVQSLSERGEHCEQPNPRFSGLRFNVGVREQDLALVNTQTLTVKLKDGSGMTLAPGNVVERVNGRADVVTVPGWKDILFRAPPGSVGHFYTPAPPKGYDAESRQLIYGKLNGHTAELGYRKGEQSGRFATHVDACGTTTVALGAKPKIWPPDRADSGDVAGGVLGIGSLGTMRVGHAKRQEAAELKKSTLLFFTSGNVAGVTAEVTHVTDADLAKGVDYDDLVCFARKIGTPVITLCFRPSDAKLVHIPVAP